MIRYVLNAKGHQRHTNNQQVQKVKVVSAERSFVKECAKRCHLDRDETKVRTKDETSANKYKNTLSLRYTKIRQLWQASRSTVLQ